MNKYFKSSRILVLFVLLAFSFPLFPVLSTVKGYIKDKTTNEPVAGAKVNLQSLKNTSVRFELETDSKGYFYKTGLVNGMYQITIDKKGYTPVQSTVNLKVDDQLELDIPMETLEVKASETAYGLVSAAQKLMEVGKYDEAIEKLTQVIAKEPEIFILYFNRAVAYEKKGDKENALLDYKKTLELKADFLMALAALGNIYAKKGEFPEAVQYFKKAFDLGITDTLVLYNYGACLINQDNTREAQKVFEKLISLDPNYADAYYQLGIIHLGGNDNAKAKECLTKFVELDPENSNVSVAKEILQTLE